MNGTSREEKQRAELALGVPRCSREKARGWYSRGYLPHADFPGVLQAITYRLADSLPKEALARIENELQSVSPDQINAERRKQLEAWLDAGHGCCVLRNSRAADCVVENWRRFAGKRYDLIAWVVMPNHVHVLIRVYEGISLGKIVQSWKSYTGRRIGIWMARSGRKEEENAELALDGPIPRRYQGRVWMREYWDRYIRNEKHFATVVNYIHQNPVKAGLVLRAEEWQWSSAAEWSNKLEEDTQ